MVTTETIIKKMVDDIDYTLYVDIVSENSVTCKNTMYLLSLTGWDLKLRDELNNTYSFENLVINESFDLIPDVDGTVFLGKKLFFDKRPFYIMGKPLSVNSEYQDKANISYDKLPLIWLLTTYVEDFRTNSEPYFNSSNIVLYFLTEAYSEEWTTEQHYSFSITVMRNLIERFKSVVNKYDDRGKINRNSFIIKPWERFGRQTIRGSENVIIDDYLSGYEVVLNLDVIKCDC